jgi:2-oxoglutarate ferredoxin oxidoreductase subunit delta
MAQGHVIIDIERCKGCDLCVEACPPQVLTLSPDFNLKGYHPAVLVEHENHCTGCSLCAVSCPDGCITVYRDIPQRAQKQTAA